MIENVIFDIGGVLVDFHTDDYYTGLGYSREMAKKLADATMRSKWWEEYDRGVFEDAEIRGFFEQDAPDLAEDIEKSLKDLTDIVTKKETTLPWISHLHKMGKKVYFLSNFSEAALAGCQDAMAFRKECEGGILSFEEQVIKISSSSPAITWIPTSRCFSMIPTGTCRWRSTLASTRSS